MNDEVKRKRGNLNRYWSIQIDDLPLFAFNSSFIIHRLFSLRVKDDNN